jgi:hypothetical protein
MNTATVKLCVLVYKVKKTLLNKMPSLQEVCDALIIYLADEIISEEEFVVLFA